MARLPVLALLLLLPACAGGGWNGSVQCAPYAREHSAINLRGAAASWWGQARGQYARSSVPRAGDVLVFRPTGRLPAGHVSVVRQVRNTRLVLVDHANWEPGRVTRRAPVEDVSPANDWTRVRVWWTPVEGMGKTVYPAFGFIEPTPPDRS
ncbi:MAG: CHAP domain-containing protein [Acetobacter sp.]